MQSKGLSSLFQYHSSKASILRRSAFFTVQLSHPYMATGKTIALTRQTFVGKVMSLLFNMLSRLVITFLPRSKLLTRTQSLCESESVSCSVMLDSLRPHGLHPGRLLCPWDSPGKNTGVGCHFLLQQIFLTQGLNLGLLHCRLSHQGSLCGLALFCMQHGRLHKKATDAGKSESLTFIDTALGQHSLAACF